MTKSEGPSRVARRASTKAPIRQKAQRVTTQGLVTRARKQVGQLGAGGHNPAAGALGALTGRDMGAASRATGSTRPGTNAPAEPKTTDVCDSCGKTVRLRKDGALYAHKCTGA